METPIAKAINHIQANLNGIGVIMNESGFTKKERDYYRNLNLFLKETKEHLEGLLEYESEYAKQIAEAQRELDIKNAKAYIGVYDEPLVAIGSIQNQPLVTDNI